MNIVLVGGAGPLSRQMFFALRELPCQLCAVAVHRRELRAIPHLLAGSGESLEMLAMQHRIPLLSLHDEQAATAQLRALRPDVLVVACYARKLPERLYRLARHGAFNIHPSLLPRYRGPEPLFWQFRDGADFGVSIHRLTPKFDAGPLVAQQQVTIADGSDYLHTLSDLGDAAAACLAQILHAIAGGSLREQPQNERLASYQPCPQAEDFVLDRQRGARCLFNFVRGTRHFGLPYYCELPERRLWLEDVLSVETVLPHALPPDCTALQCHDGMLIARHVSGNSQPKKPI